MAAKSSDAADQRRGVSLSDLCDILSFGCAPTES